MRFGASNSLPLCCLFVFIGNCMPCPGHSFRRVAGFSIWGPKHQHGWPHHGLGARSKQQLHHLCSWRMDRRMEVIGWRSYLETGEHWHAQRDYKGRRISQSCYRCRQLGALAIRQHIERWTRFFLRRMSVRWAVGFHERRGKLATRQPLFGERRGRQYCKRCLLVWQAVCCYRLRHLDHHQFRPSNRMEQTNAAHWNPARRHGSSAGQLRPNLICLPGGW